MAGPIPGHEPRRWLAPDHAGVWEEVLVTNVSRRGAATVLGIRFAAPMRYLPGQYFLLRLAVAEHRGAVEQAYSLSSSPFPESSDAEIAVKEVPTGRVSPALAHQVGPGDLLHLRGPYGFLTWAEEDGGPLGLVGAGTGIAPLVSIARYAAARRSEVPMTLLCSSRDSRDALFAHELDELACRHAWFEVAHTSTGSSEDPRARHHRRIDAAMLAEVLRAGTGGGGAPRAFYVAGPSSMVLGVRAALGTLGISDTAIYTEDHA